MNEKEREGRRREGGREGRRSECEFKTYSKQLSKRKFTAHFRKIIAQEYPFDTEYDYHFCQVYPH